MKQTKTKESYELMQIKLKFCSSAQPFACLVPWISILCVWASWNLSLILLYLRNSRWSSSPAPGWVCVILSNRRARGTGGGVESIRASALHSSPSLLFYKAEGFERIHKELTFKLASVSLIRVPVCQSPWQESVAGEGWNVLNWGVRGRPAWRRW